MDQHDNHFVMTIDVSGRAAECILLATGAGFNTIVMDASDKSRRPEFKLKGVERLDFTPDNFNTVLKQGIAVALFTEYNPYLDHHLKVLRQNWVPILMKANHCPPGVIDHERNGLLYNHCAWANIWMNRLVDDIPFRKSITEEARRQVHGH